MSRSLSTALVASVVAAIAFALAGTAAAATPIDPPRPPAPRPDLAITAASPTGFTLKNNACGFTTTPCRGASASSVLVMVVWDGGPWGTRSSWLYFAFVDDGASIPVDYAAIGVVPYDQPCGTLTVVADPIGVIAERNELNNSRSVSVGSWLSCV